MLSGLPRTTKAQRQNARKCAVKVQLRLHALAACRHRRDHDLLDQATDRLAGVALAIRLGQLIDERLDARMIGLGHLGVDAQGGVLGGRGGEVGLQLLLPRFKLRHAILDALGGRACQQGVHQKILILDHLGQFLLLDRAIIGLRRGQAVALGDVFLCKGLHQGRIHQMLRQAGQNPVFQILTCDGGAVCADRCALVARIAAAEPVLGHSREAPAAASAFDQTAEQEARLAPLPGLSFGVFDRPALLAGLDRLPQVLRNDAQVRHLGILNHGVGIWPRLPLAGLGILDEFLPVPDPAPHIELIVQNAGAAFGIAMDRGFVPRRPARPRYRVLIEHIRDLSGRHTIDIGLKYAPHDSRLVGIDREIPSLQLAILAKLAHNIIAVGLATCRFAFLDAPAEPAPRLGGEILEKERIHRAFQPDMHLVDAALGNGLDPDTGEVQVLIEMRDITLIAGQPIQRFGQHEIKAPVRGIPLQALDTGPQHAGTRGRVIFIGADNLPLFARGPGPAEPDLIIDGRGVLKV